MQVEESMTYTRSRGRDVRENLPVSEVSSCFWLLAYVCSILDIVCDWIGDVVLRVLQRSGGRGRG
jgi:hypothetical protein